jgi:hypothetical protein
LGDFSVSNEKSKYIENLDTTSRAEEEFAGEVYDNGFKYGELHGYDRALSDVLNAIDEHGVSEAGWKAMKALIAKLRAEK